MFAWKIEKAIGDNIKMNSMAGYIRVGILVFFRQIGFEYGGRGSRWCQFPGFGVIGNEILCYATTLLVN
jgi:hypothetical protein